MQNPDPNKFIRVKTCLIIEPVEFFPSSSFFLFLRTDRIRKTMHLANYLFAIIEPSVARGVEELVNVETVILEFISVSQTCGKV